MTARPLLMTLKSIADLAHVKRNTVSSWRSRNGASSKNPFPVPFAQTHLGTSQPELFRCEEVASWLEATERTNGRDVRGDAPFYSELFTAACAQPLDLLAALFSETGVGTRLAVTAEPTPRAVEDVQILVEAAFGERPLLTQIRRRQTSAHQERLSDEANNVLVTAIADTIRVQPVPLVAASPVAASIIAEVVLELDSDPVTPFEPQTLNVFVSTSNPQDPDFALVELVAAELAHCGIDVARFNADEDEIPANSFVLNISLASRNTTPAYFDALSTAMTNLDGEGTLLALAPSSLLTSSNDAAVVAARQDFLAKTESGYVEPLRYSAQLPRRWAPLAGQRQPVLWVFRRPSSETFPVALADVSGITETDLPVLTSNLVTALTEPDQLPRSVLLNGHIETAPAALRLGRVSTTGQVDNRSIHQPADSFSFAGKTPGLTPAPQVGELWAAAQRSGLDPEIFEFVNGEPHQAIAAIPWDAATSRGRYQVLSVIKGTKFATEPNLIHTESHSSGIGIVGPNVLHDLNQWEARTIGLLDLDKYFPRAVLTEPGDVIIAPLKGQDRALAVIDEIGSHVIEAPAFAVRCKKYRGRSQTPLRHRALPQLVATAVNEANTANRSSWRIPVIAQDMAHAVALPLRELHNKREQLRRALNSLNELEQDLMYSALTGAIAPRPNPPPEQN